MPIPCIKKSNLDKINACKFIHYNNLMFVYSDNRIWPVYTNKHERAYST